MEAIADPVLQRPGRILAAERERQGLGAADIAQRLHMSVSQVEALEAGDYSRLPRGTFLRGFVRNYAKTLGLVPEEVLARLAEGGPRDPAPRIVVPSQNIRFDPMADRITSPYVRAAAITALVLMLGFAAMYWWLFIRTAPPASAARKSAAETVAAARVSATPIAPAEKPQSPPPQPQQPAPMVEVAKPVAAPEPIKAEAAKPAPPKVEAAKVEPKAVPLKTAAYSDSGGTLKLRFKGRSWVEIKDAGGRVLLTGLNDAGSVTEVSGRPPFRVVVGNAPDVRMYFNDREFDLAPHMREAVARVTIE